MTQKVSVRADEAVVKSITEPPFTKSWHPVSHRKVIDVMQVAITDTGLEVIKKNYTLAGSGFDMFASWTLNKSVNGTQLTIGIRNSMRKEFALGMCAGTYTVVCSNMCFAGDFLEFRKHTAGLDEKELTSIAARTVASLQGKMLELTEWQIALKETPLTAARMKALTYDAMAEEVFPPSKFATFRECLEEEKTLNGECLYTWHGAVTRMMRDTSLFAIQERTSKMAGLIETHKSKWGM